MTTNEAAKLFAYLTAAFPQSKASDEPATVELYLEHLRPMPAAWCERAVRDLVTTAVFFPSIAELVRACGITDDDSRNQLLEAIRTGQPLVRDAASVTGWAVGRAKYPPAALPVEVPALPEPVVSPEKRQDLLGRIKALAGALRGEA